MTLDEPLIVPERHVRAAIEAATVLSNLVNDIGEHEAVAGRALVASRGTWAARVGGRDPVAADGPS